MKLLLNVHSKKIVVYREKWGTIAFILTMGVVCFISPLWFYRQIGGSLSGSPHIFIIVVCAAFAIAGAAILLRIPRYARQFLRDNGAHIVLADIGGVTLTSIFSLNPQYRSWNSIAEIKLVEQLSYVGHEGTTCTRQSLVLFLSTSTNSSWNLLEQVKFGVSISGSGRIYLAGKYPRGRGCEIESALRQFAPSSVRVQLHQQVVFDCKSGADIY